MQLKRIEGTNTGLVTKALNIMPRGRLEGGSVTLEGFYARVRGCWLV